jgi:hypothetical protein
MLGEDGALPSSEKTVVRKAKKIQDRLKTWVGEYPRI